LTLSRSLSRRIAAEGFLMHSATPNTAQLYNWLERMRDGDRGAEDELLRSVGGRLERLTHKMLKRLPSAQRWVEAEDVLQNALLRLMRALKQHRPGSMRDFFGLAAELIRRELIDLARHYYGPQGYGTHHAEALPEGGDSSMTSFEPAEPTEDPEELERWCAFHEAVVELPTEEREVVGLIFYNGWTQVQVAELFQVAERTVRRRWDSALAKLRLHLNADAHD
jgi:RNA polymerase sigma factor (sigma-70 family)